MLELLRNFLSGKKLIVIVILLAIPFVFFGSTSFGTTFTSYGTVNGQAVTQTDVNLATSQVSQRLQSVYGEEFSLDDLDEEVSVELIKSEIINQKTMIAQAKNLGLSVSLRDAKKEIINLEMFQGESGFDQNIFESTIRANGWTPEEYFELVQESIALDRMIGAMSSIAFPIQSDIQSLASILETSRDLNFLKVNKKVLIDSQDASMQEAEAFYKANPFLFLSNEKRDFSYIVLSYEEYKDKVVIPENYLDEAYADYLGDLDKQTQNRISHHMIEKSNYDNVELARSKILQDFEKIKSGKITFEDLVSTSSEDLASKDALGDLGLSSGDAFPEEFENAIQIMNVNDISEVIELEDTFHILKLTEVIKAEIKPKSQVEKELLNELIDAEAFALLQDDFLELEAKVLDGVNLYELSNLIESTLEITGLQTSDNLQIKNFPDLAPSELFNSEIIPNKIEIFEGENSYAFIMLTDSVQPSIQPFDEVMDLAMLETKTEKANIFLNEFDNRAQKILLGEETLTEVEGISKENYKSVKRFSSLLPSEVINRIFESKLDTIIAHEAINGDRYWTQSSNEVVPALDELVEKASQYDEFYNSSLGRQFSGFIDHAMKQGQRVRLQNFAVNN
jgi:peptidyl-prolyl cis-trans isomerase D